MHNRGMNTILMAISFLLAGFCLGKMTRLFDPKFVNKKAPLGKKEQETKLELKGFISEIYDQYTRKTTPSRFSVSITNLSDHPVELLGWFMRFKSQGSAISRKIEFRPQNLTSNLPAKERFTIEVSDLEVFRDRDLEDIVVRALPGGEVSISRQELESLAEEIEDILDSQS